MRPKVLMIGPGRKVHGGISGMVNNYYDAGVDRMVDLCYVGTMEDGSKGKKLFCAVRACFLFLIKLPRYDIVHVNMASDSSYYRKSVFIRIAHFFHKKIVIHQHGGNFREFYEKELTDQGRNKMKKVLSMADAFIVLGMVWKDFFGSIIGKEKISILPNAVQVPEQSGKEYGLHKILFLGRLCEEKGIGELLGAASVLREKHPDVHLYLGGVWEDETLQKKAENLAGFVTDLGWVTGEMKEKYLRECDIFALPSYFEGQPVSVLEAMAYACAVTASDTGSIPELIIHEETGFLTPPRDAQALTENLCRLLDDPELCRTFGERARRKVKTEFSIEDNCRKLLNIYENLMNQQNKQ